MILTDKISLASSTGSGHDSLLNRPCREGEGDLAFVYSRSRRSSCDDERISCSLSRSRVAIAMYNQPSNTRRKQKQREIPYHVIVYKSQLQTLARARVGVRIS